MYCTYSIEGIFFFNSLSALSSWEHRDEEKERRNGVWRMKEQHAKRKAQTYSLCIFFLSLPFHRSFSRPLCSYRICGKVSLVYTGREWYYELDKSFAKRRENLKTNSAQCKKMIIFIEQHLYCMNVCSWRYRWWKHIFLRLLWHFLECTVFCLLLQKPTSMQGDYLLKNIK